MSNKELLSIIIPVYNEEKTIETLLDRVIAVALPIPRELVIINDGSKDHSAKLIKVWMSKHPKEKIVYFEKKNGGKGSAIRTGFEKASGSILVIQDADLEYNPQDHAKMLETMFKEHLSVVYGSRFLLFRGNLSENYKLTFFFHLIGNLALTILTNVLYGTKLTDMETCYKMMRRTVLQKFTLRSNAFDIEPEITAKILKNGFTIKEIQIDYFIRLTYNPRFLDRTKQKKRS